MIAWAVGRLFRRLRALLRRVEREREMDEELRYHLEMEREELTRGGLSPEEARRRALVAFGGVERTKEEGRGARGFPWLEDLAQDLRYALRGLVRTPLFTAAVVATIGVAVGSTTVAFSWMDRVVLRPWPGVPDARRLMVLQPTDSLGHLRTAPSLDVYREWREATRAFEGVGYRTYGQVAMRTSGPARRAGAVLCSWNLFQVLRVRPQLGRTFTPEDEYGAATTAVISHSLWQRAFGGDSAVVGRHMLLNGHDVTVVGVAPPGFVGTDLGLSFDLWLPVTVSRLLSVRSLEFPVVLARLKDGVTAEQARQDINSVFRRQVEAGQFLPGDDVRGYSVVVGPAAEGEREYRLIRLVVTALMGVAVVVLLVACGNVAGLLLARGTARSREIGVRLALGAGRARLARQLLTESLLLACAGGVVGLAIALLLKSSILALVPQVAPAPVEVEFPLDWRLLSFVTAATLLCGVGVGVLPALRGSRADLLPALRDGGGTASPRAARLQGALVAGQVALSLVSLVSAGLFVLSLLRASALEIGLRDPASVLLVKVDLSLAGYSDSARARVLERLVAEAAELPGVRSAALGWRIPLGPQRFGVGVARLGGACGGDGGLKHSSNSVGPGYFETVGADILRGRGFSAADTAHDERVAVVNETMARRCWPGEDPIGRRFRMGEGAPWTTVVGVARDGKYVRLDEGPEPVIYFPIGPHGLPEVTLHLRTVGEPRRIERALRRAFERVDPNLPMSDVRTLAEHVRWATFPMRIGATVLSVFGGVGLLLAAVGLYGVLSYLVSQRTREIGVRVALGAARRDVYRLVVGRALRLTGLGLVAGLVLALGAGRALSRVLFGVNPLDPVAFGGVVTLLLAVALLAAWVPARRAASVDPVVALRAD